MWNRIAKNGWEAAPHVAWLAFSTFTFSFGLIVLLWLNQGWAAVGPQDDMRERWRAQGSASAGACRAGMARQLLAGDFTLASNAARMTLVVGKDSEQGAARAVLMKHGTDECVASCRVVGFERFQKDMSPAFLAMECEGAQMAMLRMPIHVTWNAAGSDAVSIRLGSSLYGVEEARLALSLNRYRMPSKVAFNH